MKELQNFVYRHMDSLKHHKRYLAMLTALSMLVTFIVPLILIEPADSMTGVLICEKVEHTHNAECYIGDTLNCSFTEHIHTEDCYKKFSLLSFKKAAETSEGEADIHEDNVLVPNAGGGVYDGATGMYSSAAGNAIDGTIYSPEEVQLYTLLFGDYTDDSKDWVDPYKSLDHNLEIANSEYFLGFASDFCAFIEGDFTSTDADAEGRVFVGGDLSFDSEVNKWNYQVGSGDFAHFVPLNQTDDYFGLHGFASGIVGGKLYRISTLSTGSATQLNKSEIAPNPSNGVERHQTEDVVYYYPDEGLYKRFIVGNIIDSLHYDDEFGTENEKTGADEDGNISYAKECNHEYNVSNCEYCKENGLENNAHSYLSNVNELAQLYQYNDVKTILDKTFNTVRTRSSNLALVQGIKAEESGKNLVLDARNIGDAKTVYFYIDGDWDSFNDIDIYIPSDRVTEWGTYKDDKGEDKDCIYNIDLNIIVNCGATKINIGENVSTEIISYKDGNEVKSTISNTGDMTSNNNVMSSNILYNFPNASKVTINGNFNGTILAPNADAESKTDKCPGHLSGALIAKSYYGALEFGYRPYRGGTDVLGTTSGYSVPVDKLVDSAYLNDDSTTEYLPGAMFAVKDNDGNVVSLFDSSNTTNYVALPSKIDLTGNTVYKPFTIDTGDGELISTEQVNVNKELYVPIKFTEVPEAVYVGQQAQFRVNKKAKWSIEGIDANDVELSYNADGDEYCKITVWNNDIDKIKLIATSATNSEDSVSEDDIVVKKWELYVKNNDSSKAEIEFNDTVRLSTNYKLNNQTFTVSRNGGNAQQLGQQNDEYYDFKLSQPGSYVFAVSTSINNRTITVSSAEITITLSKWNLNVTNQANSAEMYLGDKVKLTAEPELEDQYFEVSINNGDFQKVDNPNDYQLRKSGTYTFRVKSNLDIYKDLTGTSNITVTNWKLNTNKYTYNIGENVTFSTNCDLNNSKYQMCGPNSDPDDENSYTDVNNNYMLSEAGIYTFRVVSSECDEKPKTEIKVEEWILSLNISNPVVGDNVTLLTNYDIGNHYYKVKEPGGSDFSPLNSQSYPITKSGEYTFLVGSYYPTVEATFTYTVPDNTNQNSVLSLRRPAISITADETTYEKTQKLEIIPESGKSLTNLKLVYKDRDDNNTRRLNVTFTYSDNTTQTKTDLTKANQEIDGKHYVDIDCPAKENCTITKVEIIPTSADTPIEYYIAEYSAPCTAVIKTAAHIHTAQKNEQYPLLEFDEPQNVSELKLTVDVSKMEKKDGSADCVLYSKAENGGYSVIKTVNVNNFGCNDTNNTVTFSNINAENVSKIVIRTAHDSTLPITAYQLTTLQDNDAPVETVPTAHVEEHEYTIEEIEPVEGYFETNTVYEIKVVETVNYNECTTNGKPEVVNTVVTVKEKNAENDSFSYNVKVQLEESKKTVTIDGVAFQMTLDDDGKVISIDGYEIDPTEAQIIEADGKKYYYSPEAKIIVPLPEQNLTFVNKPGLLFKKVDNHNNPVSDVTIALMKLDRNEVVDPDVLSDDDNTHLYNLISDLTPGVIYYFTETVTNGKYEKPDDIYFKVVTNTDGNSKYKVIYGTREQVEGNAEGANELDITNNRVIEMVNIRVGGVKLKLKKVHYNTAVDGENLTEGFTDMVLAGAAFNLYSEKGTLISESVVTDENDIVKFNFTTESKYIAEGGYLKPGAYYLTEKTYPEHENSADGEKYANPGRIYFTVDNNFDVYSGTRVEYFPLAVEAIETEQHMIDLDDIGTIDNVLSIRLVGTNTPILYITDNATDLGYTQSRHSEYYSSDGKEINVTFPDAIDLTRIEVQFGASEGAWQKGEITYLQVVSSNKIYTYDKNGEAQISGTAVSNENKLLQINSKGETLEDGKNDETVANFTVGNMTQPDEISVYAKKKWAEDIAFTFLRSDSVTVQLYRSTEKFASYENIPWDDTGKITPVKNSDNNDVTAVLNKDNNWECTWDGLPSKVRDDSGKITQNYYYYIKEVTVPNRYEASYEEADDGTHIVTNTLKKVEIPVSKTWNKKLVENITIPPSLFVQLEWRQLDANGNAVGEFEKVPGKTLILTADSTDPWTGKFVDLPVGYEYRLTEPNVQNGWIATPAKSEGINVTVRNDITSVNGVGFTNTVDDSSLTITKAWDDNNNVTSRPEQLKLKVYRTIAKPYYEETDAPYEGTHYTDYERLLQHSLYFYDANMCGTDVSDSSALAWRSNCHIEDEVPGGYHDAGDHVMFGLPQGYTASMLGWTYYEFFRGGGAKEVNNADKEHLQVILERFYDFFVNSVHYDENGDISEILVQKGNGNKDHVEWGSPEGQVTRTNEMYWSDYGADIAAEYAAALAIGYLNFRDTDLEKYDKYLEVAKKLYKFAEDNPTPYNEWGVNKDETQQHKTNPGFYNSEGCNDDMAWAAGWLYLVTENSHYLDESNKILNDKDFWGYSWNDVTLAALCVNAYINGKTDPWSDVRSAIDGKINNSYENYFCQDSWGSARYNAIMQMAVLVAAKNGQNKENYRNWATTQMGYILGNNTWNNGSSVCLVTSFSDNSTENAHHRAASGWDNLDDYKSHSEYNDAKKHALIGGMAGGPSFAAHDEDQMKNYGHLNLTDGRHGDYADDLHDYCCNEVSIDYNAGLVGAAAGLYYFTGEGERSTKIEGVEIEAMGGTPEYTVAYSPSSLVSGTAYTLKPVAKQIGYNMVPFRRTAVRIMADGDTIEIHKLNAIVWNQEPKPANADEVTVYYYNSSTDQITPQTITNVESSGSEGSWWYTWNLQGVPTDNFVGVSIKAPNSKTSQIAVVIDDNWSSPPKFNVSDDGTATWGVVDNTPKPQITGNNEMLEGDKIQLTCDKTVTWTITQNDWAASIDSSGNIAAKNIDNETTITVKATDTENANSYSTHNVKIKPYVISSDSGNSMNTDTTKDLTINGDGFSWSASGVTITSQNGNSCTVKSGSNAENATVTAKKNVNGIEVSSTFNITITSADSITFTNTINELYNGGSFKFTVNQSDVIWSVTGNEKVSIDENGVLTVEHDADTKSVTVTAENSSGGSASYDVTIKKMYINDLNGIMITGEVDHCVNVEGKPNNSSITWLAEPSDILSIESPSNEQTKITALNKAGTVTITVTAKIDGNVVAVAKQNVTVNEYVPATPDGYHLITSYTYPEDNKTVNLKPDDLIIELDTILGNHPVDAVIVEFDSCNGNGIIYWDENSLDQSDGTAQLNEYRYNNNEKILLFKDVGYTDGQAQPEYFAIRNWYGNVTVKKVHFYAKTLVPTIVNTFKDSKGGNNVAAGDEAVLKAVGFTNASDITWSVSGGDATVENGVFKPTSKGTFTITAATSNGESATTTIEVVRIPIKLGFTEDYQLVNKTVKYTEDVLLYPSEENVTYEIVQNARIDVSSLITIDNNVVKVADTDNFGTANVTVAIQGYVIEDGEKIISNQVQVTFVGQIYITGTSELAPNTGGQLNAENALGSVTWDVAKNDAYIVDRENPAEYVVKDNTSQEIILKLNPSNGKITAGATGGTVNITATADDESASYTVIVKELPMKPIIPTEGKELIYEVILDKEKAQYDWKLDGETNWVEITDSSDWSFSLGNLPIYDSKGNPYYYYVEEYAYKKSVSDTEWKEIYNAESTGFIHANGSYIPISYTGNGSSLTNEQGKTNSITVGNKATEKPQGQLPSTGGSGVRVYYYFGGAIMLLGIAGFTGLKRRERKRRKE